MLWSLLCSKTIMPITLGWKIAVLCYSGMPGGRRSCDVLHKKIWDVAHSVGKAEEAAPCDMNLPLEV